MRHGDGVWAKPEDAVVLSKGAAARKRASVATKVAKTLDSIADIVAGHFEEVDKLVRKRVGYAAADDEAGNSVVVVNAAGSDAYDSDDGEQLARLRRECVPGLDEPAVRDSRWLDAPAIASSAGRLGAEQRLLRQRCAEGEALSRRHHRSDCSLMGRVVLARMRSRSRSIEAVTATRRAAQRSVGVHSALTAMCDDAGAGAIRCLLSSDTIFIEEAIVAEFARRRYILTHLLLAAVSTFASELQWIRLQVSDDAAHAAAAYTGLGMTDPPAEQWAEAGWHPRVDGPASCRHRILYAPVAQLRAAAAERTAGTPPPEMAVVALGCADAGVTALDVRSARAAADAALLAMRKATAESTRLWRLECDRLRSGDTVDPAHVRKTKAVFDRARQASLAYSDAADSLAIVERMAVAADGEAAAAAASDGVAQCRRNRARCMDSGLSSKTNAEAGAGAVIEPDLVVFNEFCRPCRSFVAIPPSLYTTLPLFDDGG